MSVVAVKGRAVIDVPHSGLELMASAGNVDPNEVPSPARRRHFTFDDDLPELPSFDAQGTVTAIATWRRRP